MKLALVIGRFQPLHLGHMDLIDKARETADKVLILVGSSRQLPDYRNPFSYEERKGLLDMEYGHEDVIVRPLPDRETDGAWIQDVISHVLSLEEDPTEVTLLCHPKDEKFYRENLLYPVVTVNSSHISATQVRHAWYSQSLWTVENYISTGVIEFLNAHEDAGRLTKEYEVTESECIDKTEGHPYGNPVEPVSFAVIVQDGKILVGRRQGSRGFGQFGLPGGYMQSEETSLSAAMRETKEEVGLDLEALIESHAAQCLAQAVEENLGDLGARTIGINYLFVIRSDVELELTLDPEETSEYQWIPMRDILEDRTLLFYNHNLIVKRLLSKVGDNK